MEKNFASFKDANAQQLITHGINALKASSQDEEVTAEKVSLGIVGPNENFRTLSETELKAALDAQGDDMVIN